MAWCGAASAFPVLGASSRVCVKRLSCGVCAFGRPSGNVYSTSPARIRGGYRVGQLPYLLNTYFHDVTWLQKYRRSLMRSHSRWSSGGENIADFPGHRLREIADQKWNIKNKVAGVGVLHHFSVEGQTD